jgi:hypothetical protein
MKKFNHAVSKTAIVLAFGFAVATYAHDDQPRMMQRAAANQFERAHASSTVATSSAELTPAPRIAGKHAALIADSRKAAAPSTGIDLAHAPRPITASKDPDFDQKLRENARQFQVAPVK